MGVPISKGTDQAKLIKSRIQLLVITITSFFCPSQRKVPLVIIGMTDWNLIENLIVGFSV